MMSILNKNARNVRFVLFRKNSNVHVNSLSKWYDLNDVPKRERNYVNKLTSSTSNWKHFNYPFEQIRFSGGGIRGHSYCDGLKVKFQFRTFWNCVGVEGTENSEFSHNMWLF